MQPRPNISPEPPPPPGREAPQFLSTGALQDPTLRTPGSEIPEAIYAASDTEAFHIAGSGPATSPRESRSFTLLLAALLIAIIAATIVYLYRDSHTAQSAPAPHAAAHAPQTQHIQPTQP